MSRGLLAIPFFVAAIVLLTPPLTAASRNPLPFKDGDIIFQTSRSSQSRAIQLATHSRYSHVGIVYGKSGTYYVFEAVQPVRLTRLDEWIKRGEGGRYVVKRLKDADRLLTAETIDRMKKEGQKLRGRDYDLTFEWSDERIYCSELVWKVYQRAVGVEIGKLQRLKEFDLSHHEVRKKIRKRYGANVPMDEPVISPGAMFDSELLTTVHEQ